MTDRVARRPHGRKAREVYGAEDAHSFAWEPVLGALALGPGDRLLDVGCGGGVFLRRALETGCVAVGLDHSPEMVALAQATSGVPVLEGRAERVLAPGRGRTAIFTTPPEARGTPAAPYPLATRGHFYTDAELEALPLAAGFGESRVMRTEIGAQLLVAR